VGFFCLLFYLANDSFWPLGDTRQPDYHDLKASAIPAEAAIRRNSAWVAASDPKQTRRIRTEYAIICLVNGCSIENVSSQTKFYSR
jgi:hypothetical protein